MLCVVACSAKQPAENKGTDITDTTAVDTAFPAKDSFGRGKIIDTIVCKTGASQSYALYIPSENKQQALPVIYFFDPHAKGALPLKKYQSLADEYGFILIGSNNSRNGNDRQTTDTICNILFADTQNRLSLDRNRLYVCGFSGGAKVAAYAAMHHTEIKGVIANSAGLPDETPAADFSFSFTGIAGNGDMNMTDLVALNSAFDKTQTRHRIILFDGKHEWAPSPAMHIAFTGLELDAMRDHIIANNDSLINSFILKSRKSITDHLKANDLITADQECKLAVNILNGLTVETNWFKEKDNSIINTAVYKKQQQQAQNLFAAEQNKKAEYRQQFQQGDMHYWTSTINDLQVKAKAQTAEGEMYQRLLAYLSLAFYSISNQLISNNQNDAAQYFVSLYKMDDPTNSEAWYFSAILDARNNNAVTTQDDLLKAVHYGFNDVKRILQQPEFQKLSGQIDFAEIEKRIAKAN